MDDSIDLTNSTSLITAVKAKSIDEIFDYLEYDIRCKGKYYTRNKLILDSFVFAAASGYLDIVQLFTDHENRTLDKMPKEVMEAAAINNHIHVVKYLVRGGFRFDMDDDKFLEKIIKNGHLEMLKFFLRLGFDDNQFFLMRTAAYYNQVHILKYFVKKGWDYRFRDDSCFIDAIYNFSLDAANYLLSIGSNPDNLNQYIFHKPVNECNIKIVNYIINLGYFVDEESFFLFDCTNDEIYTCLFATMTKKLKCAFLQKADVPNLGNKLLSGEMNLRKKLLKNNLLKVILKSISLHMQLNFI
jgi:ankyrin repeat protein